MGVTTLSKVTTPASIRATSGFVVEGHGIVHAGHVEHVEGHGSGFETDIAAHDSDEVEAAGSVDGGRCGASDAVSAESAGGQSQCRTRLDAAHARPSPSTTTMEAQPIIHLHPSTMRGTGRGHEDTGLKALERGSGKQGLRDRSDHRLRHSAKDRKSVV